MWRWLVILLAGILVAPMAAESLDRAIGQSANYRDRGDTLEPGKIHSSWGKRLNPIGAIPRNGFKALYFSRDNPGTVVFSENIGSIAIKYAWADFHKIDSPQFAAYWVGKLTFSRTTSKQISVSQSWAKSRVFIDGQIVFDESNSSKTFIHQFSKGEHIIEVEYVNNWHTVEFKVTIDDVVKTVGEDQVGGAIAGNGGVPSNLYYVGLYESASKDTSVNVTLPRTGKPVVLWLSSYEAIDWNVISPDPVSSVVVSSYAPGSRVRGAGVMRVVHMDRAMGVHSETKRCNCAGGSYYCEEQLDLEDVARKLQSITGTELNGYAAKYSASDLAIAPYTPDVARRILDLRAAREATKKICEAKADPDFDKMMK